MAQTIIRVEHSKENPYVLMDRRVAENPDLSWKAKGLMAYLLSRPDDWTIQILDLIKRSKDGAHAVRSGLAELEAAGYVIRKRLHDPKTGQFQGFEMRVFERPVPEAQRTSPEDRQHATDEEGEIAQGKLPFSGFPQTGNPQTENPHAENRTLLSNDSTNKDLTSNEDDEDEDARARETLTSPETAPEAGEGSPSSGNPDSGRDEVLAAVVALYEQEIGGTLTAMIFDELTDLTRENRDLEAWKRAFRASIGARNRWKYVQAVLLHPERKPPAQQEVQHAASDERGVRTRSRRPARRNGNGRKGSSQHGSATEPDAATAARWEREAEDKLAALRARAEELGLADACGAGGAVGGG